MHPLHYQKGIHFTINILTSWIISRGGDIWNGDTLTVLWDLLQYPQDCPGLQQTLNQVLHVLIWCVLSYVGLKSHLCSTQTVSKDALTLTLWYTGWMNKAEFSSKFWSSWTEWEMQSHPGNREKHTAVLCTASSKCLDPAVEKGFLWKTILCKKYIFFFYGMWPVFGWVPVSIHHCLLKCRWLFVVMA